MKRGIVKYMPRISIYADEALCTKIRSAAEKKGVPTSRYITDVLKDHFDNTWPEDVFERFVGVIKDESFAAPEDLPESLNAHRNADIEEFTRFLDSEGSAQIMRKVIDSFKRPARPS